LKPGNIWSEQQITFAGGCQGRGINRASPGPSPPFIAHIIKRIAVGVSSGQEGILMVALKIVSVSETNYFYSGNKSFLNQKQVSKSGSIIMLPELFKSDDRVRILRYVSERKSVTVQSTSQGTGVSKPVVSRYLNMLIEKGLCERTGRIISWVHSPLGSAVKRLLNVALLNEHLNSQGWAKGIGIYGSWARGTNTTESDLDLWIMVDTYSQEIEFKIAELQHKLAHTVGYEVHTLILTKEKLRDLSRKDAPFYEEFMKDQIVIRGAGIDKA